MEIEKRLDALEKRVAGLEKKEGQPRFVPCHGNGLTGFEISNPTGPGIASPE